ncbi:MAG: cytochrome c oxidase subunit 3 [Flavobacteriales bacterium]
MSANAHAVSKEELWGGGQSPFSISYGKMMMWYFLVSDALTFGGLLTAYGVIRHGLSEPWPVGEQVFEALPFMGAKSFPLIYVALMTFILIVSSVTMVLAVEAGHRMDKKGVVKWLGFTILGGFFFLGSQAWEWAHFIHGSGGGFQTSQPVHVTSVNEAGENVELDLPTGTWIHMTSDMGHAYEHAVDAGHHVNLSGSNLMIEHGHAHDAHAEHGAHATPDAHADAHASAEAVPLDLIVNKYVLEHKDGKDIRKMSVKGDEAVKLWNAMSANTLAFGANMSKNEYGPQQYSNFFFFVTGFHGFHVFQGVMINIIIWLMAIRGVFQRRGHYEMIEKIGLFWHFVDLVWVFVFTFYYLV